MAKKQLSVHIPEPCHENWDAMTPREQGRFCSVCTKTVVDFSTMSDGQIIDLIKTSNKGEMCGHFYADQLARPLVAPVKPKWWMAPIWQYIVGAVLLLKGLPAKAQGGVKVEQCTPDPVSRKVGRIAPQPHNKAILVKGTVNNELGQPVSGATILVNGRASGVVSNKLGKFEVRASNGAIITVSAAGYQSEQVTVTSKNNVVAITLGVAHIRGEMVVVNGGMRIQEEPPTPTAAIASMIGEFTVKNANDHSTVNRAAVSWRQAGSESITAAFTDAKGVFQIKQMSMVSEYEVVITAPGYEMKTMMVRTGTAKRGIHQQTIFLTPKMRVRPEPIIMGIIQVDHPKDRIPPVENPTDNSPQVTLEELARKANEEACKRAAAVVHEAIKPQPETTTVEVEQAAITQFKVQPNPVVSGQVATVSFTAKQSESIMLQLTTADGSILRQQKHQAMAGINRFTIQTAATWRGQVVFIRLMNSRGQWVAAEQLVME